MQKKALRVVISALVIVGALGFLLFQTMSQAASTYLHVEEVTADASKWYGKPLQLHGFVDGTIMQRPNTLEYKFDVQSKGQVIHATYTGIVPDTFKTGSEVVLKGRLSASGFQVEPDGVMAKCPSRYTAAGPTTATGK